MNPFAVIATGLLIAITLEKLFPARKLTKKQGWLTRAIIFNVIQLLIVIIGSHTWEVWLEGPSLFKLPWTPFYNGLFAYVIQTWIFYWWHYARHENNFLWLILHQFHHSPERIEAITSFYKHPLEIITNSWIITILTCPILGLDAKTNAWLTIFAAMSEFFYHLNVKVPRWISYISQTPWMHLAHHMKDKQFTWNYGDLSIWDMLGGTWWSPTEEEVEKIKTGFSKNRETQVADMMMGKNVLIERPKKLPPNLIKCMFISLLFLLGSLQILGVIFNSPTMKGIAIMSTASPLPFVFSAFKGVETFSTKFEMDVTFKNGSSTQFNVDHKLYSQLKGSYNRRNVIGAVFSHGPFFDNPRLVEMRNQILYSGFCKGRLTKEFGINADLQKVVINVRSKTIGNEGKIWSIGVECT